MTGEVPESLAFNQKANSYDSSAIPQLNAIQWIQPQVPSFNKEANILELGAGTGNWTQALLKSGYKNITATDVNPETLEVAKSKITDTATKFQQLDAWNKQPSSQVYDVVTSANLLQWTPYFSESNQLPFHRLLTSGGISMHCIPIQPTLKELYQLIPNIQPFLWKTEDEWLSIFQESGFTIEEALVKSNTYHFPNLQSLLRSIHNTGATLRKKSLNLRSFLKKHPHPIEVTWTYLWLVAIKK